MRVPQGWVQYLGVSSRRQMFFLTKKGGDFRPLEILPYQIGRWPHFELMAV